ncbi:hypothetical protein [Microvirga puerhi]|uniref:Uncharacterized protein n=1 Tax=Microvirga puerhi TaxID=2876078 RepID=A0ABS7VUP9_9HYPH|nr:hypothetical protein [Microvirga puerhi]MBZ6078780.1 hypothetical protein [Microvirga puerhi]
MTVQLNRSQAIALHSLSAECDLVVKMGEEIKRSIDRCEQLDCDRRNASGSASIYMESEEKELYHRYTIMIDNLTTLRANSTKGALLQIAVANSIFNDIYDNGDTLSAYEQEAQKHKFRRVIYSAFDFLAAKENCDLSSLPVDDLLGAHLNPWKSYEHCLALIRRMVQNEPESIEDEQFSS